MAIVISIHPRKEVERQIQISKVVFGPPCVDDCSKFTRINTLDRGSREAFLRALIIEVTDHNRSLYSSSNDIVHWGQISKVLDRLGVMGMQKEVYNLMEHSFYKAVDSNIRNFESHNPEDKIVI